MLCFDEFILSYVNHTSVKLLQIPLWLMEIVGKESKRQEVILDCYFIDGTTLWKCESITHLENFPLSVGEGSPSAASLPARDEF